MEVVKISEDRKRALEAVARLDQAGSWQDMLSKDVPEEITSWVKNALEHGTVDQVRGALGMRGQSDIRWRKIMTAIRGGTRIDSVAIFDRWLARNQRLADRIHEVVAKQLAEDVPFSKMAFEALRTLSSLQESTVRMGKELGVFADPKDAQSGGSGSQPVTIVVNTMVPRPSREVIVEHQRAETEKAKKLVDDHRKLSTT